MKNKPRFKRLVPVTMVDSTHVAIEVFYAEGGMNYSNYKTDPRGFYATVRPVTCSEGPRFSSEKFTIFDDRAFRVFLSPAKRFNAKVLSALAVTVFDHVTGIALAVATGNTAGAAGILEALRPVPLPAAVAS